MVQRVVVPEAAVVEVQERFDDMYELKQTGEENLAVDASHLK